MRLLQTLGTERSLPLFLEILKDLYWENSREIETGGGGGGIYLKCRSYVIPGTQTGKDRGRHSVMIRQGILQIDVRAFRE